MEPFGAGMPPGPVRPPAGGPRRGPRRAAAAAAALRSALLVPLLVLASPAAVLSAEGEAAPAAPASPEQVARERIEQGAAVRVIGRDVKGPSGEVVAQIMNVLVDGSGRPVAAVLDYGGFMGVGRRRIAVVWRALRFAPDETPEGTITLGLTRDQLKNFPEAKRGEPVVAAAPAVAAGAPR